MDAGIISRIAQDSSLPEVSVAATVDLLEKGATAAFIVHYRKEVTGGLGEAGIRAIQERYSYYREVLDRRASILKLVGEQGKLTDDLKARIEGSCAKVELEDLYHQFRPKKRTRAAEAIEKGLEPLAEYLWNQEPDAWSLQEHIDVFVDPAKKVANREQALQGATEIVAHWVAENLDFRKTLREMLWNEGAVVSTVVPAKAGQKTKYNMYYDRREPVTTIPSHRVLAIRRGSKEGILTSSIEGNTAKALDFLLSQVIRDKESAFAPILEAAVRESYNRTLRPLIETEVRAQLKERADREAIRVFQENLANLLLSPPAGQMVAAGLDLVKSGECTLAVVNRQGGYLESRVFRFAPPRTPAAKSPQATKGAARPAARVATSPAPPAPSAPDQVQDAARLSDSPLVLPLNAQPGAGEDEGKSDLTLTPEESPPATESAGVSESEGAAASLTETEPAQEEAELTSPASGVAALEAQSAPPPEAAPQAESPALGEPVGVVEAASQSEIAAAAVPSAQTGSERESAESAPSAEPPRLAESAPEMEEDRHPDAGSPVPSVSHAEGDGKPAVNEPESPGEPLPASAGEAQQAEDYLAKARATIRELIAKHSVEAVAIGAGTGARELETILRQILADGKIENVLIAAVNDAGIAVYSSSRVAREELPDLSASARCAVSLARRLQDPLAELVKIDPKLIGVGQYQHDVDQKELHRGLLQTVQFSVNKVGVDLNTAGYSLLRYTAGLNDRLAHRVTAFRNANGPLASRWNLLKIPGFDSGTFSQAAGFLRIRDGENPLDATAVHPEAYPIVEKMAAALGVSVADLIGNKERVSSLRLEEFVDATFGLPTLTDIREELLRPGRDPRRSFALPKFRADVRDLKDLQKGMVLEGTVTNVTNFGAFVDIGVHQDGLVHLSQMSNRFIRDPREAVRVGDVVQVKVISVEAETKRIGLSMKALLPAVNRRRRRPNRPGGRPPRSEFSARTAERVPAGDAPEAGKQSPGVRPERRGRRDRDRSRPRRREAPEKPDQLAASAPKPQIPEPSLQEKIAILQSKFRGIN
jgi:uncharacterized protein